MIHLSTAIVITVMAVIVLYGAGAACDAMINYCRDRRKRR